MQTSEAPLVFYQSAPTEALVPTALQVLQVLDELTDSFNGIHDVGPKGFFFYPRRPRWRKARKYECEDLEDHRRKFEQGCGELELSSSQVPALLALLPGIEELLASLDKECQGNIVVEGYAARVRTAIQADPEHALAAWRLADKDSDLWLRAALRVDASLPAPWDAWTLQLWTSYRYYDIPYSEFNASDSWSWEDHQDAHWATAQLVKILRNLNWMPDEAQMSQRIDAAKKTELKKNTTSWTFDPGLWAWVTKIHAPGAGLLLIDFIKNSKGIEIPVLFNNPIWPQGNEYFRRALTEVETIPPMPEAEN